jgi:hypothetical protein
MSSEEDRLAQLLKRLVPEPPAQLSADEITTPSAGRPAMSWTMPALAAAAVVAIGVTVGLLATQLSGPGRTAAPQALSSTSGSASPQASATCRGRTAVVPNVVGESMNAAIAIIQDAGLNVGIYTAVAPGSARVPQGTVSAQSLPAGSEAVPGAEVELAIASAPATSTEAPIDPGMEPTEAPTPLSPCQVVGGTPPAANATQSVPNVVGMTVLKATAVAQQDGFSVTITTAAPESRAIPPGTVFAQTPSAGSSARPGSGMILYASPAT